MAVLATRLNSTKDGNSMRSNWDSMFTALADKNEGKTFTRALLLFALASMFPADYKPGSQGPTDYRGVLDAEGNVTRASSQSTQYKPILFVGTGDSYTVLPASKRILKPSTRSASGLSDAQLKAELEKRGISL